MCYESPINACQRAVIEPLSVVFVGHRSTKQSRGGRKKKKEEKEREKKKTDDNRGSIGEKESFEVEVRRN